MYIYKTVLNQLADTVVSVTATGKSLCGTGATSDWLTNTWKCNTVNSRYLEVVGTIFYKFKLPEVHIYLHFG